MKTLLKGIGYSAVAAVVFVLALVIVTDHKTKADKPPMPVSVQYRRALLNPSLVADFKNNSNRNLMVVATFTNPTLNNTKAFTLSMDPGRSVQFGYAQGWAFHSGDTITLRHADYQDEAVKLP